MNRIEKLCAEAKLYWQNINMELFGVMPAKDESCLQSMAKAATEYWNSDSEIFLKTKILAGEICKGIEDMIPNTWEITVNPITFTTALSAEFNIENRYGQRYVDRRPIFLLPTPLEYTYLMNKSEFCYRILAELDSQLRYFAMGINALGNDDKKLKFTLSRKLDDGKMHEVITVKKDPTGEFIINTPMGIEAVFKYSSPHLTEFLTGYGYAGSDNSFISAIKSLATDKDLTQEDIRFFAFYGIKEMLQKMIDSTTRFASPTAPRPVPINLVYMITKKCHGVDDKESSIGVLTHSKIFSVENMRTVICMGLSKYSRFKFGNTTAVFDAFKTSTNVFAGRIRMLLDNVTIGENGCLMVDGKSHFTNPSNPAPVNLSSFSTSNFFLNNSDKRLMMSGKLKAQAVNLTENWGSGKILQSINARTVFGDFGAWSFGDNIIISESFAKRLEKTGIYQIKIYAGANGEFFFDSMKPGDEIKKEIITLTASKQFHNLKDISFISYDKNNDILTASAKAPIMIGDKITNLHSSKGIVGMILPDGEMPHLENDIIIDGRVVYPAGPFEVILSGISSYERKNVSQIIDAACIPLGVYHNSISELSSEERMRIQEFCSQSMVTFNGTVTKKPIGIQEIIRLNHDSTTKFVQSKITLNTNKMLKFEEMLILNLGARNATNILHECKIRNVTTDPRSIHAIYKMQGLHGFDEDENRSLPTYFMNNNSSLNYMKSLGYKFQVNLENPEDLYENEVYHDFASLSSFFENKVY